MIEKHSTDKLFEIHKLQTITKLYATAFVQHIHAYHLIFGVPDSIVEDSDNNNNNAQHESISELNSALEETNIP